VTPQKRHAAKGRDPGTVPTTVPGSGPAPEEPEQQERLGVLERERDEYLDSLQRLKAEFDNFRKRTAREQEAFAVRANEALLKDVLPVLDDLERALEAAEHHDARIATGQSPAASTQNPREAKLEEGVRLVHRSLLEALQRRGLELIETDGAFDPHVHEALLTQPGDAEPGSVLEVLQKGYRLGDRVLRPARVVVAE
jgi:molecular chaperone GrpE